MCAIARRFPEKGDAACCCLLLLWLSLLPFPLATSDCMQLTHFLIGSFSCRLRILGSCITVCIPGHDAPTKPAFIVSMISTVSTILPAMV